MLLLSCLCTKVALVSRNDGKPLVRNPKTGRFADEDLASVLHDATENVSGAFSARNTPEVLRIVEIMGITQARKWGVCTVR